MLTLPTGYEARIAAYDRELRVRWSEVEEAWLFERKFARAASLDRVATYVQQLRKLGVKKITPEQVNRMADGYQWLANWEPCLGPEWCNLGVERSGLPKLDRIMNMLQKFDTQRMVNTGDVMRDATILANALDARDEDADEKDRKWWHDFHGELGSEAYDAAVWREKLRIAVPRAATGVSA